MHGLQQLALLTLFSVGAPAAQEVRSDRPPNIILMMADDLGASDLGCYGNEFHRTPHLDRLATGGLRFRTCYATPICSSSRVLIMTGRYAQRTRWYNFTGRPGSPTHDDKNYDLGDAEVTFADVLRTKGYATALAGKWQLTGKLPTLVKDCGFDEYSIWAYKHNLPAGVEHTGAWQGKKKGGTTSRFWHPSILRNGKYMPTQPYDYGPDLFADFVIDFVSRHRDQPFLVYFPMVLTHKPWTPTPHLTREDERTKGGLRHNVESMDRIVGRIVGALDDLKIRQETIVIFTGDNGTQGKGKARATEAGARVPLIVNGPRVKPGVVSDALTDLSDILPTLADLAGARLPADRVIDGVSFLPVLTGESQAHRNWAFSYLHDRQIFRTERFLLEGDGKLYDCGDRRDGQNYLDVTASQDPAVKAARSRFDELRRHFPAPELDPCPYLERQRQAKKKEATVIR